MIPIRYKDPFAPVMMMSPPVTITQEQQDALEEVFYLISSDNQFALKGAKALRTILGGGINQNHVPIITSLNPPQRKFGSSFNLKVNGSGFDPLSSIYFNEVAVTTSFISDTQLSADIDLSSAVPGEYPVVVLSGHIISSNTMMFTVMAL